MQFYALIDFNFVNCSVIPSLWWIILLCNMLDAVLECLLWREGERGSKAKLCIVQSVYPPSSQAEQRALWCRVILIRGDLLLTLLSAIWSKLKHLPPQMVNQEIVAMTHFCWCLLFTSGCLKKACGDSRHVAFFCGHFPKTKIFD